MGIEMPDIPTDEYDNLVESEGSPEALEETTEADGGDDLVEGQHTRAGGGGPQRHRQIRTARHARDGDRGGLGCLGVYLFPRDDGRPAPDAETRPAA